MPIAANATHQPVRKECRMKGGHRKIRLVLRKLGREFRKSIYPRRQRHEARKREEAQHKRICWQIGRIAPDDFRDAEPTRQSSCADIGRGQKPTRVPKVA